MRHRRQKNKEIKIDNEGDKENQIFSYLEEVSKVIEDNQENFFAAQKQIETLWISMMKNKLEDLMLTFSLVIAYHFRVGHTSLSIITGNGIAYLMYKEMIKNKIKGNKDLDIENLTSYKQFKESLDLNQEKILRLGAFFIDMLSTFPADILERSIQFDESKYGELAVLKINSEHLEEIKKNIVIPPSSLPMICLPNPWSDNSYGGYLENKYEQKSLITGSTHHKHVLKNK